jgi:calcineurin-like phosphoesterase family protein
MTRRRLLPCLLALAALAAPPHPSPPASHGTPRPAVPPARSLPRPADPVIAAAGDIACDPDDRHFRGGHGTARACRMRATSDLLLERRLAAVLTLGDNQYEDGSLAKFRASFDPTWGRLKPLLRPTPGNHDYDFGWRGYHQYFGAAAGEPGKGWYSFDLGAWHLIALNSSCEAAGGCGPGSPQARWLAADLAAHPGRCILAYWHHPRFSSGRHGGILATTVFWKDLYAAGADVVLNGHDHVYERFAPQTPGGAADPARGIRQFVVGTGGKNATGFEDAAPHSEVRHAGTFGVLEMTLRAGSYSWRFLPEAGGSFTDTGSALCHAAATATK